MPTNEQDLYQHLLKLVKVETPQQLIERFRTLFIDGSGYPDPTIADVVGNLTTTGREQTEFNSVLNRCCHILINHWQMESKTQLAIPELVNLFETPSLNSPSYRLAQSRNTRRLRGLVQQFRQSEQYMTLHRLVQVVDRECDPNLSETSRPLGSLIGRYPYLYSHSLLNDSSTYEHQQTVRQIQAQKQKQYEVSLSKYVTYKVRKAQLSRQTSPATAKRVLKPVENPTLLDDRELYVAVKQFAGRAEGSYTYRDLAQNFITHTSQTKTFREFKEDLYEYLVTTVDSDYGKRQFNAKLYQQLMDTMPQCDSQKLTDFLIVRTCSQLLNFLVVESPQKPNHYVLIDLLSNLGPTFVMALLLKIILICRRVKPYLEKRFSILFNHYDSSTREAVQWLIQSLENLNVALSTNFGAADLSFLSKAS
ncbi:hypothetical protein IQ235_11060 [Oscillatoriales cyanobacterium LEGE 11467]|uniref:Uncharacterized protein n=1 Tax=Zarconia navalis LEGE 11467 TaxID=1828826 RepID=A0A928Z951_9CYAN|nr:hypothetical protein [Zarconia navalis]MBE9041319.1 hypothetical protein [Zarconia navalis LEGE 11467]